MRICFNVYPLASIRRECTRLALGFPPAKLASIKNLNVPNLMKSNDLIKNVQMLDKIDINFRKYSS